VSRTLLCCAALAVLALPARAEQTVTSTETLVRLTVRPMAAPKPALRYLLLPELKEMNPGNPIPNYLKCNLDQDNSSERSVIGRTALRQADWAARLDKPDWQITLQLKTEGIGLLIPDVQKMRELASALQERFREENAQRRFDDSIRTAKTMFAMARHMSEHPTLIGDLVGIAIAFVAIGPLEEMLEKPGCPNLYWALTNLPRPLVSLDKGLEGERVLIRGEFRLLNERDPMSADQINKLVAHVDKLRALADKRPEKSTRAWLNERNKDEKAIAAARARLVEVGFPAKRLQRFPADQVFLLDEYWVYEVRRDEVMKLANLPAWQAEAQGIGRPYQRRKDTGLFADLLVPALGKVFRARVRLEQRIALLRHVEALRLYAAAHAGKLPAKLSDCEVPLPPDPFTGKPFHYQVDGATAHLRGSPPPREAKNPAYNVHFQVTIQK
jgi:hypothetical protein